MKDAVAVAIETLGCIQVQKLSERLALARAVKQLNVTDANAVRYGYGLVCETVRCKNLIDAFINSVLKPKTLSEFPTVVQAFLRLYVYQARITRHWAKADVAEAASFAGVARSILGWKTLRGIEPFLGLLLTRSPEQLFKDVSDEKCVALQTFHPLWFVKYCFRLLGRREAIAFLQANVYSPPTYIRLNTLRASQEAIIEKLVVDGVNVEKIEQLRHTYRVKTARQPLTQIESYQKGLFCIQDKASCYAAEVADPRVGMTVLDVCAAPGAKTTYIAQLMQNKGKVYSVDFSSRRINVWRKEISRMGVKVAEAIIADARCALPFACEVDVAVLDPPCTGSGVFGRFPSAKWRLSPSSVKRMSEIQWQIINSCAEKVKAGGSLVYSTCSVTVEENEMVIERFLRWHPEFSLVEINPKIGLPGLRGLTLCQRLYPHLHECNGFFIAKLQRE
ncbi:MAG: RsmB/NOP family class I SAM-dependent RNA methyltransferase [Candidatus Bathyarchaeia archaeon]